MTQTTETATGQTTTEPGVADRIGNGVKSVAGTIGESTKSAAASVSAGVKSAGGTIGETIKKHPYTTAAAVGGVAAAAAGAVVGKKYYDKHKAREALEDVGLPEMRSGEAEVAPEEE